VQAKEEDKNLIKKAEYTLHQTKKKIHKCLRTLIDYQVLIKLMLAYLIQTFPFSKI